MVRTLCIIISLYGITDPVLADTEKTISNVIDSGDTAWVIAATTLVMLMTPGLGYFYSGMVHSSNAVSTLMHSYMKLCVISLVWLVCGYSLSFGTSISGFIGNMDMMGFKGVGFLPSSPDSTIPHILFATFQGMFAVITTAIITGSFAERVRLFPVLIFSVMWVVLVYSPIAHWVWGNGWMAEKLGPLDFAGGAVVHISSGVAGLVAALFIGNRSLSNKNLSNSRAHNLPMTILGGAILWFGWFGFNAGSVFAANGLTGLVIANTNIASAAGTIGWFFTEYICKKKSNTIGIVSGSIAGLVAITPAAGFVTPLSSIFIGLMGGILCYWGVCVLKPKLNYDDSLDAFGLHGIGGMWGAIATGIFATTSVNELGKNGLLYGNPSLVWIQFLSIITVILYVIVVTYIILILLNKFVNIRVSQEEEKAGLDKSQNGESGYNMD
jgi:Amt family ammonium transporter